MRAWRFESPSRLRVDQRIVCPMGLQSSMHVAAWTRRHFFGQDTHPLLRVGATRAYDEEGHKAAHLNTARTIPFLIRALFLN